MKTKILLLTTLIMALVACGPAATLVPTETALPLATFTLVPATPTITVEPTVTFEPISDTTEYTGYTGPLSICGESVSISSTRRKLTVEDLHVTLEYPADWECDTTGNQGYNYYSGTDGFFHVMTTAVRYVKDWCEAQVRQSVGKGRNLYGVNPTMKLLEVDNQPACLVLPSDPKFRLSMLAVESPDPDAMYGPLIIVDADKNHIDDFIDTLKFIR